VIINNYWTIVIIVGLILGILVAIYNKKYEGFKMGGMVLSFIIMQLVVGVVSVILGFLILAICMTRTTESYSEKKELVSVNDYISTSQKVEGSFFLGIGSINGDSQSVYNVDYAYKDENGIIRPSVQNIEKSQIGFKEDGLNSLEITYEKTVYGSNKLGEWLFNDKKTDGEVKVKDYIFHVPEKSIIKDSKIDLK
jgi:lipopolysaccharide export LptBFGC system permease protein LptF